ncbi:MKI67 FHA domain-interacting nucleolar phosphoprotein [Discoglossus pictus]
MALSSESAGPEGPLLALDPERQEDFNRKVQQIRKKPKSGGLTPGVIYIGHIPRGLFEPQLKEYFDQFGTVTRLRLSRSKKTGTSKGYAFVEFECEDVAKIVADTMNNYLFCERLLKCEYMPPDKVHTRLFVGCERVFKKPLLPAVKRYNKKRTPEQKKKMTSKLLEKEKKLRRTLAEKGIDYEYPGFASQKKEQKDSDADISVNSQDPTPVCTPSLLERRKSIRLEENNDSDDEIVLKMPEVCTTSKKKQKISKIDKRKKIKKLKLQTN